jgi:hypothetical protein
MLQEMTPEIEVHRLFVSASAELADLERGLVEFDAYLSVVTADLTRAGYLGVDAEPDTVAPARRRRTRATATARARLRPGTPRRAVRTRVALP